MFYLYSEELIWYIGNFPSYESFLSSILNMIFPLVNHFCDHRIFEWLLQIENISYENINVIII